MFGMFSMFGLSLKVLYESVFHSFAYFGFQSSGLEPKRNGKALLQKWSLQILQHRLPS